LTFSTLTPHLKPQLPQPSYIQMGNKKSSQKKEKGAEAPKDEKKVVDMQSNMKVDDMMNFSKSTHFDNVEVTNLYKVFTEVAKDGKVDGQQFHTCLAKLAEYGFQAPKDKNFPELLFHMLDTNNDGNIDLKEFIGGLSVLCKGTPDEKIKLTFKAYDLDNSGTISKQELTELFRSAWLSGLQALVCEWNALNYPKTMSVGQTQLEEFSVGMAQQFAEQAFASLDSNGDGQLSLEEFATFVKAEPKITATFNDMKKDIYIAL